MDKQQLQKLLQKKYSRDEWNSLLSDIFPSVNLLKEPEKIEVNNKNVKSFHQTGLVRLKDGKNLAVFEVILDDGINLLRNRVALRNLTTRYIDEANNHGVLVVYDQGKENYRFTFVSQESGFNEKGEWATFETASKRFTYILGEGESCRTASERLALLASKKTSAKLNDVIDAFSVEQLSKEFFTKYKAHYQAFVDYLVGSNFKKSMFSGDDKAIRDFVKKMLGRIVFLYFLQKKGWLGASDESYSDGDKSFMQTFWESSGKADTFYSQHLTRLFFKGLNATDREKEFFEMPDGKKVKIPYLNGGLFDKDRNEPELLTFPSNLFNSLFSFFAEYNFTIDENDPEEHEVGIDPEMLGHIFENLLEDNKDKGAYYTPKEIVQYMTQESLIEYLKTGLEKKNQVLSDDDGNALKYFVRYKLKGDEIPKEDLKDDIARFYQNQLHFIQTYGSQVNRLLDDVKICDPAIGSGAFPMGLLNEIYHCKLILNNTYSLNERAKVKRHIIENSIYGVDIEKGAVDIARLRFWLSLIVDEEKPSPLPNLDYKIVPGDSLISRFEDEVIDIDWNVKHNTGGLFEQDLFDNKTKLLTAISEKQKKYFDPSQINKEKLNLEIRNLKLDILINQLRLMIAQKGGNDKYTGEKKSKKQFDADLLIESWKRTLGKLEILKQKPEKPFNHFDWKLDFPEILNSIVAKNNVGFDIVIGNPPWGAKWEKEIQEAIKKRNKDIIVRMTDSFMFFINESTRITKSNGIITKIIPEVILNQQDNKLLRSKIISECTLINVVNLGDDIFNDVTRASCIIQIQNKSLKEYHYSISEFKKIKGKVTFLNISQKVNVNLIYSLPNFVIPSQNVNLYNVLRYIKETKPLNHFIDSDGIQRGVSPDYKKAFIIDSVSINQNNLERSYIKKTVTGGKDFERYHLKWNDKYLIYTRRETKKELAPNIISYISSYKEFITCKEVQQNKHPFYSLHRAREEKIFTKNSKVLGVITGDQIIVTLDTDMLYPTDGVYLFSSGDTKTDKVLVGILNSKLITLIYRLYSNETGKILAQIKPKVLETIPFKLPSKSNLKPFTIIVDYLLSLYTVSEQKQIDEYVPNSHIIELLKEVVDAMVMELYFKSDFEREGIEFIKYVERDFKPIDDLPENKKIEIIRETYQKLREKENEIRNNLKLMDTRLSEIVMPIKSSI